LCRHYEYLCQRVVLGLLIANAKAMGFAKAKA
jgi:hypothetical protein